jgi:hypothetical protein
MDGTSGEEADDMETGTQPSQQQTSENTNGANSNNNNTSNKRKGKGKTAEQYPCLCCGENCTKSQQAVKCLMCTLWAHKDCVRMSDAMFKSLEVQLKETGTSY